MTWTVERVVILKRMHADGVPFSAIATEIGVTRNAAIGKAKRLGLPDRQRSGGRYANWTADRSARRREQRIIKRVRIKRVRHTTAPAPRYIPPPIPADAPEPRNLSILDLATGDCRWPVTADHPMLFCGHKALRGWSYCPHHFRRAHS